MIFKEFEPIDLTARQALAEKAAVAAEADVRRSLPAARLAGSGGYREESREDAPRHCRR